MAPPPENSQTHQPTLQLLSSVLSQRGPSALPYAEDTKWLIRQHLLSLASSFPSLDPKATAFTHNDGRTVNLLQAGGTIPMAFQGVTYNIPVIVWLVEDYPRNPPCVYVNPTREMVIKRNHPNVSLSGLVSVPYLQNWIFPSSNLVDLVKELGAVFGRDPPLFSQRRPNPNPSPNLSLNYAGNHSNSSHLSNWVGYGGNPARSRTNDAAEVYRKNAVSKIVESVDGDILQLRKSREGEMESLFSAQSVLRRREAEINNGIKEMAEEKEALEFQLQVVLMNTDVLQAWVGENKGKMELISMEKGVDFDVDSVFECGDSLSKQMLECSAADLAVEDAVYCLDRAVQEGVLGFDQYLRSVRLLSREQFFHRAIGAKVRAVQRQAQVAAMAARVPRYDS